MLTLSITNIYEVMWVITFIWVCFFF